MDRTLYINKQPPATKATVIVLTDSSSIDEMLQAFLHRLDKPVLLLDARGVQYNQQPLLLKFIEDYPGSIQMMVNEPVQAPILSRFMRIEKEFTPTGKTFTEVLLGRHAKNPSIKRLFNIETEEEDFDDGFGD